MSRRGKNSKRFVIDTDVARSAGGERAISPSSKNCRDFLKVIRNMSHYVVMTPEIRKEWNTRRADGNKYKSRFTTTWLYSMYAKKLVYELSISEDKTLRKKIIQASVNEDQCERMLKDVHLIEAALATDNFIISLNEAERILFSKTSQKVGEIKCIIWVNPDISEDEAITWLQNGSKEEERRRICDYYDIILSRKCTIS
jgi:hypothetical protein